MTAPACVIPAFDAEHTLAAVARGLRQAVGAVTVIVIDDGSRDGTARVADGCADHVVRFPANRGKGAALRAGFAVAATAGATTVLTIDADGQHPPALAPALLAALSCADVVLGVRRRRGTAMPWHRQLSNAVSAAAVSACAGRRIADSQSGYRAFRVGGLARIAAVGDRYEYETGLLIEAARAGLRIATVDIPTIYGMPSHFRAVRDSARVVHTILKAAVGHGIGA